jgi:hypothetical protein
MTHHDRRNSHFGPRQVAQPGQQPSIGVGPQHQRHSRHVIHSVQDALVCQEKLTHRRAGAGYVVALLPGRWSIGHRVPSERWRADTQERNPSSSAAPVRTCCFVEHGSAPLAELR